MAQRAIEEQALDPGRVVVDAHHHLYDTPRDGGVYLLDDLWRDTGSGHRVVQTVHVEAGSGYRPAGPPELRPVGETEWLADIARTSAGGAGSTLAGIVARADLGLGRAVGGVLDAHAEAGAGLLRGIRHAIARAENPAIHPRPPGRAPAGLAADPKFREGVRLLGERSLTYESYHYHFQLPEFIALARSAPDTVIILDHVGMPLGFGPYGARRQEIFSQWRRDLAELARLPHVVAKLGGLAQPENGFGWERRATSATSDEIVAAHRPYYEFAIEQFGPRRCMFESNFPVDKLSVTYSALYNAFKKIVAACSDDEQDAMFSGTARRVYRLDEPDEPGEMDAGVGGGAGQS